MRLASSLLFAVLAGSRSQAQAQLCATPGKDGPGGLLDGVVNTYHPVTASVAAGATSAALGTATGASTAVSPGDLLLFIQMQDASINSTNTDAYGDGAGGDSVARGSTNPNGTGLFEFVKATNSVALSGGALTFQGAGVGGGLLNSYTNAAATATQGQRRFQVVRVPQYTTATLGSGLTASAWNGTSGGILVLDVSGALNLGGVTVSVDGLGFRGAGARQLTGDNGGNNTDYRTLSTSDFNGGKGEGIAGTPAWILDVATNTVVATGAEGYPNGSMARGAPGNAGGGGTDGRTSQNDRNPGGGGGGNGGIGGQGGNTWYTNLPRGGFGGDLFTTGATRVILGGGGGAATRNNGSGVLSSGSAGGGIVLVRAASVTGSGTITANGARGLDGDSDGGGGGGAGGTVVVATQSGSLANLTVSARGGKGGDAWPNQTHGSGCPGSSNCNDHGPGGGGGGGAVLLSSAPAGADVSGGSYGTTTLAQDPFGATAGGAGTTSNSLTLGQIPGLRSGSECAPPPTPTPTFTLTPTRTFTLTPSNTPTNTRTNTPTQTSTPVPPTPTFTLTPSNTPTNTRTNTPTQTSTPVPPTPTFTLTPSNTPTNTATNTPTQTPTLVPPTPTFTLTPSNTPTNTATNTPTQTPTLVPPTPTFTLTPSNTPTNTATNTPTQTSTPVPPTPTFTLTPSNTPSSTPTPTQTPTSAPPTPTSTPTPTLTETATQTPTPTITPTPAFVPVALDVDLAAGAGSDGNTVFEPGETAVVLPSWQNTGASSYDLSGAASAYIGPAGATYSLVDGLAAYGLVAPGSVNRCDGAADCDQMFVSSPPTRPATHWDSTFVETMNHAPTPPKTWVLHVGDSFTDVPRAHPFYKKIETIFHNLITVGCTPTDYCPTEKVPRSQMAIFIARGLAKGGQNVPSSGTWNGQPYNCSPGGTSLFADVKTTDIFCKSVHYIAVQNVTSGCAPGLYCSSQNITRAEMGIFIAKAIVAPAGGTAVPLTYGPDPVTGFSYSCDPSSPNLYFTDVALSDPFCKHVHFLWARGIIAGCPGNLYCPTTDVGRDEMSKFLSNAFNLLLYGP